MGILDAPGLSKSAVLADRRAAAFATNPEKTAAPWVSDYLSDRTSTTTLGSAPVGGAWTALQGTWGTDTNGAYLVTTAGDTRNVAYVSTGGRSRYRMSCDITLGSGYDCGLVTQVVDASNYALLVISGGRLTFYTRIGGGFNQQFQTAVLPSLGTSAIVNVTIESSGLVHEVYLNSVLVGTSSLAANDIVNSVPAYTPAATRAGVYSHSDTGTRFRNFTVGPLPEREWKTVCATFKDDNSGTPGAGNEALYLLGSNDDGATWRYINSGVSPFRPKHVGRGVRDPSIFYNSLDGWWYVAYTRSASPLLQSTYPIIGIVRTRDLRSGPTGWFDMTNVPIITSVSGSQVWAPEWFVDTDGSIHLLAAVNLGTAGALQSAGNWRIHCWHPSDPTDLSKGWGNPTPLTGPTWPATTIDPAVIKVGSTYHMFYANESAANAVTERAQSTSLHSGWTITDTGNWMNWPTDQEGAQVIKKAGGGYRCFADTFGALAYKDSPDMSAGSWGASMTKLAGESKFRHGTIYQVPTSPAGLMSPA